MANILKMPKMSDTMTEGTIVSWQKKVGDNVKSGDILAEIETDKATMELESYDDGTILFIGPKEGEKVLVDSILAIIGKKGEDYKTLIENQPAKNPEIEEDNSQNKKDGKIDSSNSNISQNDSKITEIKEDQKEEISQDINKMQNPYKEDSKDYDIKGEDLNYNKIKASPLAKKVASEMGYDLSKIHGSGQNGRIIRRDLQNLESSKFTNICNDVEDIIPKENLITNQIYEESYEDLPLTPMRNAIAANLKNSLSKAPHFYITDEIVVDEIVKMRTILNKDKKFNISYNDIIIKACSISIRRYPDVNVAFMENAIRFNKHIHLGIAVAIKDGLVVPVLKFADTKTLSQISSEIKLLSTKAKEKQLPLSEMQGGTFCISNLGMFGIDSFTSIINPPSACILAIGSIKKKPIINDNDEIVLGHTLKVTLSCDHRVIDGAIGAKFLQIFKNTLENPIYMLI